VSRPRSKIRRGGRNGEQQDDQILNERRRGAPEPTPIGVDQIAQPRDCTAELSQGADP
jgi:hypothetical protein